MQTDVNKIKRISKEREFENCEFKTFLKICDLSSEEIDSIVHELYQTVSSKINCKTCANCCKEMQPVLDTEDIIKFSKCLKMTPNQFIMRYLNKDTDSNGFTFKQKPCPFLKSNLCSFYDCRPKTCVSFPYLHKKNFTFRLIGVIENYSICPIVFNVFEALKAQLLKK